MKPDTAARRQKISLVKKKASSSTHARDLLVRLYAAIVKPRMIEEKMLLLLRQGKVSKWFSGIGQEAIAVGASMAMDSDEFILPLHRNLGVFTVRGLPLIQLFAQLQGKKGGFTKGRDRSFHFGTREHHIVGMISHLGPQLAVADGIALAHKLKSERKAALVFSGEGGTSEGDFHEALNVAAVWDLPVIFLIENNGYGLSTPAVEQFRCVELKDRALGYGIEGVRIDGNDLLEVYDAVSKYASEIRQRPRPVLIECMTFRMRGHEEASGVKYVPKELFEEWAKKDPVALYEERLIREGVLDKEDVAELRAKIKAEIDEAVEIAFASEEAVADTAEEVADIYAEAEISTAAPSSEAKTERRFVDAVSDGLKAALKRHQNLIVMGQDIAEYGGVFKVTEGFVQEFGRERIRNTPLCESAILGAALGLSVKGFKSVVEMQFSDFVTCGFNQIVNNLAKSHYRWGQNADVVVRMPTGAGTGAGPFHSQSTESWFAHVPGLKVVYPSTPYDAKGLLIRSIEDPNPVMFFEHKLLYRSVKGEIPDDYYSLEIGKAKVVREGSRAAVITYGLGVQWAEDAARRNPDWDLHIVDLRTLLPFDKEEIQRAASLTGRVLVLHEDTLTGGIGGEIAAFIAEKCFESLDAPVMRCASLDTPVPFASSLEANFLAKNRLDESLKKLIEY